MRKTVGDGDEIDTLYVNKYYEENVADGANVTVSYYINDRLIAQKNNNNLMFIHQDHLSGTSMMTTDSGTLVGSVMKYYPFGDSRNSPSEIPTDRLFTGQRYDDTGLYYYGARYYDPEIGRFISPDTIVPDPMNPQSLNRYSYCMNNPLKYVDPRGHEVVFSSNGFSVSTSVLFSNDPMLLYMFACGLANSSETTRGEIVAQISGWAALSTVAPELTGYLEKSSHVVTVNYANIGDWGANSPAGNGNTNILLKQSLTDPNQLAQILGHEGLHAAVQIQHFEKGEKDILYTNTWLEPSYSREAFAGSFEYKVARALNVDPLRPDTQRLSSLSPPTGTITNEYLGQMFEQLESAVLILNSLGYHGYKMWSGVQDPYTYAGFLQNVWMR